MLPLPPALKGLRFVRKKGPKSRVKNADLWTLEEDARPKSVAWKKKGGWQHLSGSNYQRMTRMGTKTSCESSFMPTTSRGVKLIARPTAPRSNFCKLLLWFCQIGFKLLLLVFFGSASVCRRFKRSTYWCHASHVCSSNLYDLWMIIDVLQQIIIQLMIHNYVSPLIKELRSHFRISNYFLSYLFSVDSFFCESFNGIDWLGFWIFSQPHKQIDYQSTVNLWQILFMHFFKLLHCR